jgi:porin
MLAGRAAAGPLKPDLPDATPGVTGDWGGMRTRLRERGWAFQAGGTYEAGDVLHGGSRDEAAGAAEIGFGATADLAKLLGGPTAWVQVTVTDRMGNDLGPKVGLKPAMPFIEVHGRGDKWRLTDLFYEQQFAGGRADVKLGRVTVGEDFDDLPCEFQNLTFCGSQPGNLVGDYWFNHPVSQWGGRLKVAVSGSVYLAAGAYQVNPRNLAHGFDLSFGGGKGVLTPAELSWSPKLGAAGLPGTWRIGGWYSSANGPDVLQAIPLQPSRRWGSRYGGYFSIQQQVTGKAKGAGLSLFANATLADRHTALTDRQVALGASYKGLLPGRAADTLALALGWTRYNDRVAGPEAQAFAAGLSLQRPQHTETAAELDYRFVPLHGLTLTPNLQVVHDVAGVRGRNATVLGVRAVLSL